MAPGARPDRRSRSGVALLAGLAGLALLAACPRPAPGRFRHGGHRAHPEHRATAGHDPRASVDARPPRPDGGAAPASDDGGEHVVPGAPRLRWRRVRSAADLAAPLPPGAWRVHLIDVGTGLSVLVQGPDATLLYDAGTNDPGERPLRVVAYLAAALGASRPDGAGRDGADLCVPPGAAPPTRRRALDHVVLSHPHLDHASALDVVLHCYQARHVWDSGRVNQAAFYRDFLTAVARQRGATYHTAADLAPSPELTVKGARIRLDGLRRESFREGDVVPLGATGRFTILHAEAKAHPDPNQNTVVLAVELAGVRLLLTGDAESGPRAAPDAPLGDVEAHLVEASPGFARRDDGRPDLRADILQVGHHGSMTSTRAAFLRAVAPRVSLISAGPKAYRGRVLPDREIVEELEAAGGVVLRTDAHDGACDLRGRLGGDRGPGGCDSYVITIAP